MFSVIIFYTPFKKGIDINVNMNDNTIITTRFVSVNTTRENILF